jgi:hypothetical protein
MAALANLEHLTKDGGAVAPARPIAKAPPP